MNSKKPSYEELEAQIEQLNVKIAIHEQSNFEKILNQISDIVYTSDKDGNITYVNSEAEELSGFKIKDILGKSFMPLFLEKNIPSMIDVFKRTLEGENLENTLTFKNGNIVNFSSAPLRNKDNVIIGTVGIGKDVTKSTKENRLLIESEARFKTLYNASFGGITIHDKGVIFDCNQGLSEITGFTIKELIGMDGLLLISKKSREMVLDRITNGYEKSYEAIGIRKNGEEYPVQLEAKNIPLNGKQVRVVEFRDITEHKKAELELKESEEKYRELSENIEDMVYRMKLPEGIYEYVSASSKKIFGYSPNEFYKHPILIKEAIHPDSQDYFKKEWGKLIKGNMSEFYEYKIIHQNKDVRWISQHNTLIKDSDGKPIAIQGIVSDITDKKNAEYELIESEKRLRDIIHSMADWVWEIDENNIFTFASESVKKVLGYEPHEIIGKTPFDLISPEDVKVVKTEFEKIKLTKAPFHNLENLNLHKNGTPVQLLTNGVPIFDKDNNFIGYRGVDRDITENEKTEKLLKESERRFKQLAEQSPFVYEVYDIDGLQIEVNKAYEDLWQFPEGRARSVGKFNVLESEEVEDTGLMTYVKKAYAGETVTVPPYEFDSTGKTEGDGAGRARWLSTKIYPLKDLQNQVTNIVITHEDITIKVANESKIQKSLAEKEILLREIDHRVKNNLNVLISILNLQINGSQNDKVKDALNSVRNRVYSMSAVYQNLQSQELSRLNSKNYIDNIVSYIGSSFDCPNNKVEYQISLQEDVYLQINEAIHLGIIINELITNSIKHAFPETNGKISISFNQDETYKYLEISDNGIGMPTDCKKNLGSGLIESLVESQLEGTIILDTSSGTKYKIKYPKQL